MKRYLMAAYAAAVLVCVASGCGKESDNITPQLPLRAGTHVANINQEAYQAGFARGLADINAILLGYSDCHNSPNPQGTYYPMPPFDPTNHNHGTINNTGGQHPTGAIHDPKGPEFPGGIQPTYCIPADKAENVFNDVTFAKRQAALYRDSAPVGSYDFDYYMGVVMGMDSYGL